MWSVKGRVWSVERGVWSAVPATKTATHLVKTTQKYCACHTKRHSTRYHTTGCERLSNVERTHPQPPDPQSETGTLATHSGTNVQVAAWIAARPVTQDATQGSPNHWPFLRRAIFEASPRSQSASKRSSRIAKSHSSPCRGDCAIASAAAGRPRTKL